MQKALTAGEAFPFLKPGPQRAARKAARRTSKAVTVPAGAPTDVISSFSSSSFWILALAPSFWLSFVFFETFVGAAFQMLARLIIFLTGHKMQICCEVSARRRDEKGLGGVSCCPCP